MDISNSTKKENSYEPYYEKDNMGTRHDTSELAEGYWLSRNVIQKFEPFILYEFNNENDAREALLELDCFHAAVDTGKIICTETLIFGYYKNEVGKYSVIIVGDDLSHKLWKDAKVCFQKHNGKYTNAKNPNNKITQKPKTQKNEPNQVKFVREEKIQKLGQTFIYKVYKALNAISAKDFLKENPVDKNNLYFVVETPEGNYCRDLDGIYKE